MSILIGFLIGIVSRLAFEKTKHYLQEKKNNNKQLTSVGVPALSEVNQRSNSPEDIVWNFALNCGTALKEDEIKQTLKHMSYSDLAKCSFSKEHVKELKEKTLHKESRAGVVFNCVFTYMTTNVSNADWTLSEEEKQFVATALIVQERIRKIYAEQKRQTLQALADSLSALE